MQRYRSGHNEAVLKTVCPQGHVGSNPTLCAKEKSRDLCRNGINSGFFIVYKFFFVSILITISLCT